MGYGCLWTPRSPRRAGPKGIGVWSPVFDGLQSVLVLGVVPAPRWRPRVASGVNGRSSKFHRYPHFGVLSDVSTPLPSFSLLQGYVLASRVPPSVDVGSTRPAVCVRWVVPSEGRCTWNQDFGVGRRRSGDVVHVVCLCAQGSRATRGRGVLLRYRERVKN